jgi:hypothetical protein
MPGSSSASETRSDAALEESPIDVRPRGNVDVDDETEPRRMMAVDEDDDAQPAFELAGPSVRSRGRSRRTPAPA